MMTLPVPAMAPAMPACVSMEDAMADLSSPAYVIQAYTTALLDLRRNPNSVGAEARRAVWVSEARTILAARKGA